MRIIGVDFRVQQQTIAMLDDSTGELVEKKLLHKGNHVREFYSALPRPALVGIEAPWLNSREPGKWSGRAVARYLGVSHTWIQKLVRQFSADPCGIERDARRHFPATFEQLSRAQDETRKQKERGWPPRRWRWAEFKIGDEVVRAVVPTKAEERRQAAEASGRVLGPAYVAPHELPLWARGMPYYSQENPCDP
jgi:hypothetical protein